MTPAERQRFAAAEAEATLLMSELADSGPVAPSGPATSTGLPAFSELADTSPGGEPWPFLHPLALHGLAGEFVSAVEPHSEADPVALLGQFLAVAGCYLGTEVYAAVEGSTHPPRLFVVLVGRTSRGRKGTSLDRVREVVRLVDEGFAVDNFTSGLSSGEGLIVYFRDPSEAVKPSKARGGEVETVRTEGVEDKRLCIVASEYAAVLRVLEREGNTLSAVLRDLWDHGNLRTMTKNSPLRATGAHGCILGHIVADELARYLSATEAGNGYANRHLFLRVRRSKLLPEGGGRLELGGIAAGLRAAAEWARGRGELVRDAAARELWRAAYPILTAERPGLLGSVTSRAEAQVLRLSVVYAALDRSRVVTDRHLAAALALWRYAEESAAGIFGGGLGDGVADEILRELQGAEAEGLARSYIRSEVFGRNVAAGRIGSALRLLEAHGLAEKEMVTSGHGRPAEVWRVTRAGKGNAINAINAISLPPLSPLARLLASLHSLAPGAEPSAEVEAEL